MTDFLLELRSEEIPARMQAGAREELRQLFGREMGKRGLSFLKTVVFSTPRRIALIARDLSDTTIEASDEVKGPKTSAPSAAIEGFCRKTGANRDQLIERDGVLFFVAERSGRPTIDVLAEVIPAIVRGFAWPKAMRWGEASASTASLRWVRPLQGIVALFGDAIVACEVDGIVSEAATLGHRFHAPRPVTIGSAHDYADKLRLCHVIVDHAEREATIRAGAAALASEAGFTLVTDEALVVENAGLTEWPVPLLGSFDPAFLDVPPEVITLTARVNQKYFVMRDAAGRLAPRFVATANIAASDGGAAVVAGNEKVLAARLADARFFWEQDLKVPLADRAAKLSDIVFHEKLGTVADKVDRVAKLARWLCEQGIVVGDPALAERAARLCKADLVTGMVGEFPELQGVIGGHLARAQGEDDQVADAIRDHYKPVGQGDDVPTAPVTVAVSLADKLDSIGAFFGVGLPPTGSKDPFALRRAAIGVIAIIERNGLRLSVGEALRNATMWLRTQGFAFEDALAAFVAERLKVQQRDAGVRPDIIDAVFALGEDDLIRLLALVRALQAFVAMPDGTNLLAGYKRAANILKKDDIGERATSQAGGTQARRDQAPEEQVLAAVLANVEPRVDAAIAAEDFAGAMTALASLRAPIDAFFDAVMVNDPDAAIRARRLALLARFRDAVHRVADFSRIEG